MFHWFRSKFSRNARRSAPPKSPEKEAPPLSKGNPGVGVQAKIAFSNPQRSWHEEVDLVTELAATLREHEFQFVRHKGFLEMDNGIILQPRIVSAHPLDDGGVRTVTTIDISHAEKNFSGLFEYQHACGNETRESVSNGFKNWAQLDLIVLVDALRDELQDCTAIYMDFSESFESTIQGIRRVILGPVSYMPKHAPDPEGEDHPAFCPCCLFTNTVKAFKPLIESQSVYAIRLYAMRNQEGVAEADCRVNGEDHLAGKEALMRYVDSWADRGFEFRKQYVLIQTAKAPPQAEASNSDL